MASVLREGKLQLLNQRPQITTHREYGKTSLTCKTRVGIFLGRMSQSVTDFAPVPILTSNRQ